MNTLNVHPSPLAVLALTASALCACGEADPVVGHASLTGTVAGGAFNVSNALSAVVSDSKGASAYVVLTSDAGLCGELGAGHFGKSQQRIEIALYTVDSAKQSHAATVTGDYSLNAASATGLFATFDVFTEDASCTQVITKSGSTYKGTVHVSAIDGQAFSGSFDVTWGQASEHLTGTFGPAACPGLQKLFDDAALTCQ